MGHVVLRKRTIKLLWALLIALWMQLLHCDCELRFVSEILSAVKKQGTPLTIIGAIPVGLHHQRALGAIPPATKPEIY